MDGSGVAVKLRAKTGRRRCRRHARSSHTGSNHRREASHRQVDLLPLVPPNESMVVGVPPLVEILENCALVVDAARLSHPILG